MKRTITYILLFAVNLALYSQALRTHDGNATTGNKFQTGFGSGEVFNPFAKDTTKSEHLNVPKEIHQWHIDELTGDAIPVNADTLPHLYQNWHLTEGMNGEYNFLGNMGAPRESRIFFNRTSSTTFDFLQPYDYFIVKPNELFFTDTKSPYTNIS